MWDGTYLQGFGVVLRLVVIYINTPTEKVQQFLLNAPAAEVKAHARKTASGQKKNNKKSCCKVKVKVFNMHSVLWKYSLLILIKYTII